MALRLVSGGISWPLAKQTKAEKQRLQQDIETAMKQQDPLTVNLADGDLLILNGKQLAHVLIFEAGTADKPKVAPMWREDGVMHVRPVAPGGDDAGIPPGAR
jgi:hypothetical protein